jgi:hypothetical protein
LALLLECQLSLLLLLLSELLGSHLFLALKILLSLLVSFAHSLALDSIWIDIDFKTRVDNLVEAFANLRCSFSTVLHSHDLFDALLRLLNGRGHILILLIHGFDETLIHVFLADDGGVLTYLTILIKFLSRLVILLSILQAKTLLCLLQNLL